MAIQKSEWILLRRQDIRETSVILTFYTKDFGKIRGIVRGVRGARAQSGGGSLEIFAMDGLVFYERKRADVCTISQCDLIEYFNPVRESLERLSYATYMAELLDSVTALYDKNAEVFSLMLNSLRMLSGESSPRRVARIFEIKLLGLLGLMPNLGSCVSCGSGAGSGARFSFGNGGLVCRSCLDTDRMAISILPGTVKFIEHVRTSAFDRASRARVTEEVGRELERILRRFLDFHIERKLKSVQFIKDIEKL